jgi:hypothetical protein
MSRDANLGDKPGYGQPHLMVYGNRSDVADCGADLSGSAVMRHSQFQYAPEPLATSIVAV